MLAPPALLSLASDCAPSVAPQTLLALARAESGLDPLAIGVNGAARAARPAATGARAVAEARALLAAGRDIDVGLLQLNIRTLARQGLTLARAFDPCVNLAAGARVLAADYAQGRAAQGPGQAALRTALSLYNTGDPRHGFANGYVARVVGGGVAEGRRARPAASAAAAPRLAAPAWDVFGRAPSLKAQLVFVLASPGATP